MSRLRSFLLLLVFAGAGVRAAEDTAGLYVQLPGNDGKAATEILQTSAFSPEEAAVAEALLSESLDNARAQSPSVKAQVIVSGMDEQSIQFSRESAERIVKDSKVKISEVSFEKPKGVLRRLYERWFERYYRITFTLVEGVANGGFTTWSLMVSKDVPPELALLTGLAVGTMCGGFQYFNAAFQNWLTGNRSPDAPLTKTDVAKEMGRWYLSELGFLGLTQVAMTVLGIEADPALLHQVMAVLSTSFLSTIAQAPLDISVAHDVRAEKAAKPEKAHSIQLKSDLKTLLLSTLSVTLAVAQLSGQPWANYGLLGLATVGGGRYLSKYLKHRSLKKSQESSLKCEKHLSLLFIRGSASSIS